MAYLRRMRAANGTTYLYIAKSVRRGDRVLHKVLEYLGRADKVRPERVRRACAYWGVKPKGAKRKAKRGRRAG